MPELPEVETTRRALQPIVSGKTVERIITRCPKLRWPIPAMLSERLTHGQINGIKRRGKYLLFTLKDRPDRLLVHLGMSGSLRVTDSHADLRKHDHVILSLNDQHDIRLHDPRRFGAVLLDTPDSPHPLLRKLGVEPLDDEFSAELLKNHCKNRRVAIKTAIMNAQIVVGVGNIYACEALFAAGINPQKPAGKLSDDEYAQLVSAIKRILKQAIEQGGTTLRDFLNPSGNPGYFKQTLYVYDRADLPCKTCGTLIRKRVLNQRSTYYCPHCQS